MGYDTERDHNRNHAGWIALFAIIVGLGFAAMLAYSLHGLTLACIEAGGEMVTEHTCKFWRP